MNKRILALILVLLVGFGLWALLRKKPEVPAPSTPVEVQTPSPQQEQPARQQQERPTSPRASPPVATTPDRPRSQATGGTVVEGVPVAEDVLRYVQNVQADPQYDWKQPINFYGSVLDENNQPVSGATASFEWTDLSQKGTSKATAISDANGFFSLTDQQGKRLFVDVAKDGYYSSGNARGAAFEYANPGDGLFTPDAANPVVFHLRKKGEAAQLIHGLKLFGSRVDGSVSYGI